MQRISEQEFQNIAQKEDCGSNINECNNAVAPTYVRYTINSHDLLKKKIYPLWRINQTGTQCILEYQIERKQAFPISYTDFASKPHLFQTANFDEKRDYFETNRVILFHCKSCGVYVVKDGNHRLLQCAIDNINRKLFIYEVISHDWSKGQIDMKNFCECTS